MKAILYFDEGSRIVADIITPIHRKERETQRELEERLVGEFNASQPLAVHKIVRMRLMRN